MTAAKLVVSCVKKIYAMKLPVGIESFLVNKMTHSEDPQMDCPTAVNTAKRFFKTHPVEATPHP